jgi:hypothetical protein
VVLGGERLYSVDKGGGVLTTEGGRDDRLPPKISPFEPEPILRDHFSELRTDLTPRWVKPTLVVDVEYRQRSAMASGMRHWRGYAPTRTCVR